MSPLKKILFLSRLRERSRTIIPFLSRVSYDLPRFAFYGREGTGEEARSGGRRERELEEEGTRAIGVTFV